MVWILIVYMHGGPFSLPLRFHSPDACEAAWSALVRQDPERFENGKASHLCAGLKA